MNKFLLALIFFTFSTSALLATSFAPPEKRRVYSPNKKYFALIDPNKLKHSIYNSDFPAIPIWSFKQSIQFDDIYISNDGNTAIWVAWSYVQIDDIENPAVAIFKRDSKACYFSFLSVSKPRKYAIGEIGPIGDFWRIWVENSRQIPTGIELVTPGKGKIFIDASTCKIQS